MASIWFDVEPCSDDGNQGTMNIFTQTPSYIARVLPRCINPGYFLSDDAVQDEKIIGETNGSIRHRESDPCIPEVSSFGLYSSDRFPMISVF